MIDEDPRLHLLWHKDKVYIKPIPPYLLSAAFWDYIQTADPPLFRAAAGFMRTYVYLIRYETDFRKATSPEWELIPTHHVHLPQQHPQQQQQQPLTFETFTTFLTPFSQLTDADVSPRYAYGQLRLGRLNHLTRLVLRRWSYFPRYSRLADELGYFVAAVVALFSVVSIFLSCMQVEMAVLDHLSSSSGGGGGDGEGGVGRWSAFVSVSRWFPVVMMVLIILLLLLILALAGMLLLKEAVFTLRVLRAKKTDRAKADGLSSFVAG